MTSSTDQQSPIYIQRITAALPRYEVSQDSAALWLKSAFQRFCSHHQENGNSVSRLYDRLAKKTGIDGRRTVVRDYAELDPTNWQLFDAASDTGIPTLGRRMQVYAEAALELARRCYEGEDFRRFERVCLVSCTGYDSPSVMQRLLPEGWGGQYLMLGHMGCYAALPAVAMMADCLRGRRGQDFGQATIFLCELCTLHLNPAALDPEQQVINMLFADGAVRMDLGHEGQQAVFEVMGSFEYLLPNSLELMTWRPGSRNFEMTLSSEVPKQIERVIHQHVQRFLHGCGLRLDDIAQWAIHPGGLKIIESVAKALGVGEAKIRASQAVYRSRGNMSSTTVPHIWLAMLEGEGALQSGDFVASLAFGPGLTMVGNLLRRC